MLELFYITNNPDYALIAQNAGVERIFVDMEYIGKEERQPNMNTVKSHHTVKDVERLRSVIDKSKLLVRVNPMYDGSEQEINDVINAGADVIMLPMWKGADEVKRFLIAVDGRAKACLLLETAEAAECIDGVLALNGVDEIHIGLNDLHLSMKKKFMFELLCDGTVDALAGKMKASGIPFGIGGVGCVNVPVPLSAKHIICEHYRLGSSRVILSRSFCNPAEYSSLSDFEKAYNENLRANREYERLASEMSQEALDKMHNETAGIIRQIVSE